MKQHIISGTVAAAVAASISAYAPPKQIVTQVTHEISASKHAWPDLTDAEKAALAGVLKTVPETMKFDIVCNDAACTDLAMDIDDAMEQAGLTSELDHSVGPLGYGIAIQVNAFDKPAADEAAAALKKATNGRLDLPVMIAKAGSNAPGYVTILIGKHKAPAAAQGAPTSAPR